MTAAEDTPRWVHGIDDTAEDYQFCACCAEEYPSREAAAAGALTCEGLLGRRTTLLHKADGTTEPLGFKTFLTGRFAEERAEPEIERGTFESFADAVVDEAISDLEEGEADAFGDQAEQHKLRLVELLEASWQAWLNVIDCTVERIVDIETHDVPPEIAAPPEVH